MKWSIHRIFLINRLQQLVTAIVKEGKVPIPQRRYQLHKASHSGGVKMRKADATAATRSQYHGDIESSGKTKTSMLHQTKKQQQQLRYNIMTMKRTRTRRRNQVHNIIYPNFHHQARMTMKIAVPCYLL
jgi:hypothetical protein